MRTKHILRIYDSRGCEPGETRVIEEDVDRGANAFDAARTEMWMTAPDRIDVVLVPRGYEPNPKGYTVGAGSYWKRFVERG